jgi:hypothetical protein
MASTGSAPLGIPARDPIAAQFATFPEVERVYMAQRGQMLFIWVVLNSFDRSLRNKIYELEHSMFSAYPHIGFDFNLVRNCPDANLDAVAPEAVITFQR